MVVVNLYPFYDKVTSAGGIDFEDGIENIDIGGPAMIRAAAKVIQYYTCQSSANFSKNKYTTHFLSQLKLPLFKI